MLESRAYATGISSCGEIHPKKYYIYNYLFDFFDHEFIFPVFRLTGWHNEKQPGGTLTNQLPFYTSGFL